MVGVPARLPEKVRIGTSKRMGSKRVGRRAHPHVVLETVPQIGTLSEMHGFPGCALRNVALPCRGSSDRSR